MNKQYIIRKNEEINLIIKKNNKVVNKYFVIYFDEKKNDNSRFCISVSKKFGKAHERNLYKRRIKDIIMKNIMKTDKDYVIILREQIKRLNYEDIKNNLLYCLKGEKYE